MKQDLVGRLERWHLSMRDSLYPLFEAVSNSIQAVEATKRADGFVNIDLRRSSSQTTLDLNDESTEPIEEIKITDNGIGFTDENMAAFEELDTRYKIQIGGKGVGRLTWFKVFEKATIESIYMTKDGPRKRSFEFKLPDGIENLNDSALDQDQRYDSGTTVLLLNPLPAFEEMSRYGASRIAAALVRHFLHRLLLENPPKIELKDGPEVIIIEPGDLVDRRTDRFEINSQQFGIEHLKIQSPEKPGHLVYYTAARRTVTDEKLKDLPEGRFPGADNDFYYQAYVSSPYLDNRVNAPRTDFVIEEDEPEISGVSWKEIRNEVTKAATKYLDAELKALGNDREERIERVLKTRLPELAYVREYNAAEVSNVPLGATDAEVEETISAIHLRNQRSGREMFSTFVADLKDATTLNLKSFESELSERIEQITRPSQASLASYLLFRRSIIEIYHELLKKSDDRFQLEAAIHKLLFPMVADLDTAKSFKDHNLWLLDERLTFADYIASDLPLKAHKALFDVTSAAEPDVVCYFNLGFSEDDPAEGDLRNVVIVELKKPGPIGKREENPYQQVMRYIRKMHEGTWESGGEKILATDNTRFHCFIVCDLDQKLIKEMCEEYQFKPVFDGFDGHTLFNPAFNAYIELVSFEKVLRDAKRKHRVFFDRLGITKYNE